MVERYRWLLLLLIQQAAPLSQQQLQSLTSSAEAGDTAAQSDLGLVYLKGLGGVPIDHTKAYRWLRTAASGAPTVSGTWEATTNLAVLLSSGGPGVAIDLDTAAALFAAAADSGHVVAQRNLAVCYRHGNGIGVDKDKAAHWLRRAASAGSSEAQVELAELLAETAESSGARESASLLRQAASIGSVRAMHQLAVSHLKGTGGAVDVTAAVDWFQKASTTVSEASDDLHRRNALLQLGVLHQAGTGPLQRDLPAALRFYGAAAALGEMDALANSGVLLLEGGDGVQANPTAAIEAFQRAADGGSKLAARFLVRCHENGMTTGDTMTQMQSAAQLSMTLSSVEGAGVSQADRDDAVHVFYRLSDDRPIPPTARKSRPPYISVRKCLSNFMSKFGLQRGDTLTLVADSCTDELWQWLVAQYSQHPSVVRLVRTEVGNPGSWRVALAIALSDSRLQRPTDNSVVYMVEDDYVHRAGSRAALLDGLQLPEVAARYDHRDKYLSGQFEDVKLMAGLVAHWRQCTSTTMTFGALTKTFRADFEALMYWTSAGFISEVKATMNVPKYYFPWDHQLWLQLGVNLNRTLVSPLPSYSTHGEQEFLAPMIDWESEV